MCFAECVENPRYGSEVSGEFEIEMKSSVGGVPMLKFNDELSRSTPITTCEIISPRYAASRITFLGCLG